MPMAGALAAPTKRCGAVPCLLKRFEVAFDVLPGEARAEGAEGCISISKSVGKTRGKKGTHTPSREVKTNTSAAITRWWWAARAESCKMESSSRKAKAVRYAGAEGDVSSVHSSSRNDGRSATPTPRVPVIAARALAVANAPIVSVGAAADESAPAAPLLQRPTAWPTPPSCPPSPPPSSPPPPPPAPQLSAPPSAP
eukprot:3168440-Pleurochrysis_carterae.AAC.1